MSKSTNTVVYFDWKTVIYIYVCRKCRTQFMLPMEKSVTFTGACANEIIPSINRSFVYKAKEGLHVRITVNLYNRYYLTLFILNLTFVVLLLTSKTNNIIHRLSLTLVVLLLTSKTNNIIHRLSLTLVVLLLTFITDTI
jgi:hypothetical protein